MEEKVIKDIICNKLGCNEDEIHDNTNLRNDLGADSFDMVEIVMDIEYKFKKSIPDSISEKFVTFEDIMKVVKLWKE